MRQVGLFNLCRQVARHWLGAGLAVLLFLILQALAASPHLHHLVHDDSHQPDHECPVKLLSDGQVDVEPSGGFEIPNVLFVCVQPLQVTWVPQTEFRDPPGRAPPSFFS